MSSIERVRVAVIKVLVARPGGVTFMALRKATGLCDRLTRDDPLLPTLMDMVGRGEVIETPPSMEPDGVRHHIYKLGVDKWVVEARKLQMGVVRVG